MSTNSTTSDPLAEYRKMHMARKQKLDQLNKKKPEPEPPEFKRKTNLIFKADPRPRDDKQTLQWFEQYKQRQSNGKVDDQKQEEKTEETKPSPKQYKKQIKEEMKKQLSKEVKKKPVEDVIYSPINSVPISPSSVPCALQIRMLDGEVLKAEFQSEDLLTTVCEYVCSQGEGEWYKLGIVLSTVFPRRKYSLEEMQRLTLRDVGLVPKGNVVVEKQHNGFILKQEPKYKYVYENNVCSVIDVCSAIPVPAWRLRGESQEEKEKFKEKMRLKEIEEKKQEKLKKKRDLEKVRKQIEEAKQRRKEMFNYSDGFKKETTPTQNSKKPTQKSQTREPPKESLLKIRLLDGSTYTSSFPPTTTLEQVYNQLVSIGKIDRNARITIFLPFPMKKEIKWEQMKTVTLLDVNLVPSGSIIFQLEAKRGVVKKGDDQYHHQTDEMDDTY